MTDSDAVRLRGELNVEVLGKALCSIIARHEILRTTIQTTSDGPSASVRADWSLKLKKSDLTSLPLDEREAAVERALVDEPRITFNLGIEPGIRVTLLHLGHLEHVPDPEYHHIICDWASWGIFWRELSALYRAGRNGQALDLPCLAYSARRLRVLAESAPERSRPCRGFGILEENLRGAPPLLDLPADKIRPHNPTFGGAKKRLTIRQGSQSLCGSAVAGRM